MSIRTHGSIVLALTVLAGFGLAKLSARTVWAQNPRSSTPVPTGAKTGAKYLGCYADRKDRDLQVVTGLVPDNAACQAFCAERGFNFAATQWGS